MNRTSFFAAIRTNPFNGLTAQQTAGTSAILDEWDRRGLTDLRFLAYMLGTVFHECARTMQPITELGGRSYFDKYNAGTKIGKTLGNTMKGDGFKYRGRGFVQLTGRANYAKAWKATGIDLIANPDRALEPTVAAHIMFWGMTSGAFTGKKLADYFTGSKADWMNARRIINGTDKAQTIAGYAKAFYAALQTAAQPGPDPWTPFPAPLPPIPPAIATPAVESPQPVPPPASKTGAAVGAGIVGGLALIAATWGHLTAWVAHLFGG